MEKETKPGLAIDSKGNPIVDPTKNVLDLVESAVGRINDIHSITKEFQEKLLASEIKRIDELRIVQVRRLEDSLNEHKEFNRIMFDTEKRHHEEMNREKELRLQQKFDSMERAITKAESATEKRFEGVNEFRNTLADQQRILMPRTEYESAHRSITDIILGLDKRLDKTDALKQGGNNIWILIVGIVGFAIGMISFAIEMFGNMTK